MASVKEVMQIRKLSELHASLTEHVDLRQLKQSAGISKT